MKKATSQWKIKIFQSGPEMERSTLSWTEACVWAGKLKRPSSSCSVNTKQPLCWGNVSQCAVKIKGHITIKDKKQRTKKNKTMDELTQTRWKRPRLKAQRKKGRNNLKCQHVWLYLWQIELKQNSWKSNSAQVTKKWRRKRIEESEKAESQEK